MRPWKTLTLLALTATLGCDDGTSPPPGASEDRAVTDQRPADMTAPDAEVDQRLGDAERPDAEPTDAAPADAGPRPPIKHPGWCGQSRREGGALRQEATRTYDARGNLIDERVDAVDGPDWHTTWEYDGQDRLIRKTVTDPATGRIAADERYAYTQDGLLREASHQDPLGEVLRWTLDSSNGQYTALRSFVNDNPQQSYSTLEWDLATGRLQAHNVHRTADDAVLEYDRFEYKPRNPGEGKLAVELRDQDFDDGVADVRTTCTYEPTRGILSQLSSQRFARDGTTPAGAPTVSTWDHLILDNLHEVRSWSVNGELRETYTHRADTVEVQDDCRRLRYAGRIEERQGRGGIAGFHPRTGGAPLIARATADFAPTGPLLHRTECDGTVSYEADYDAVGNLLAERRPDSLTEYTYGCWD